MLPMCLGWAGLTLPSKINAAGTERNGFTSVTVIGVCEHEAAAQRNSSALSSGASDRDGEPLSATILTVLVHEHADGDAAHVEAVQEVLDVLVGDGVHAKGFLVLQDALSHGGHHVVVTVTDVHQSLREAEGKEATQGNDAQFRMGVS